MSTPFAPRSLLLLPLCALAQAQDAAEVLARYMLQGKPAVVSRTDVALELAFHLRRREEGTAACNHLVESRLVLQEAGRQGVLPTNDEVRAFWNEQQRQLRAIGRDPMQEPIVRNSTEAQLLQDLSLPLALERLVRKELELGKNEAVGPDMQRLWLQEVHKRHRIVADPDQLPAGVAVRIDDQDVPMVDLGLLLLRKSDDEQRDRFVRQVAWLHSLEALARTLDVTVTPDDLRRDYEARRANAARDGRFQGLSFEQLLKSQGLNAETLQQSRTFRAQVLLKKVVARQHPREQLLAEAARDPQGTAARIGPRRRLSVIFARATATPNPLLPRDVAAATAHLQKVKQRLGKDPFDLVARIESEDPASKERGGDVGWFVRSSKQLPEPVLAAAWSLGDDGVSDVIATEDGCYLVKVEAIEPALGEDVVVERLREVLGEELSRSLLTAAALQRPDGTPFDAPAAEAGR